MLSGLMLVVTGMIVSAQGDGRPTCRSCPATYISNDELQAYITRAIANRIVDQQVRSVDVGRTNVAVGLRGSAASWRRRQRTRSPSIIRSASLIRHHRWIGYLATVPDLVDAQPRPADNEAVRMLNGPGSNAASIRNPVLHELKAGDVIVILAGTGHWYTKIDDLITYLMIRLIPIKFSSQGRSCIEGGSARNVSIALAVLDAIFTGPFMKNRQRQN